MLQVVAEAAEYVFCVDSEGCGDYLVAGVENIFDYCEWAFPGRSFSCYSFVMHFSWMVIFMSTDVSIHSGVITLARRPEISSVPVTTSPGLLRSIWLSCTLQEMFMLQFL